MLGAARSRFRSWEERRTHAWLTQGLRRVQSIVRALLQLLFLPISVLKLRQLGPVGDVGELFALAERGFFRSITPHQVPEEITGFLDLVKRHAPRRILEIGTLNGGTLFLLCRTAAPDARIASVDLPHSGLRGLLTSSLGMRSYPGWKVPLLRAFASGRQELQLLRLDSHEPATLERVRAIFAGEPLDLLFIDGDHSYAGVKRDLEMYGPLVREGGLVAFHDIAPNPTGSGGEVPRFWAEIKALHEHEEFVADWRRGYGIGVIKP